jgi:hypothetical protein
MIRSNNKFMRLYFVLTVLLFSKMVDAKEFSYEFQWLYVPVAKLSINFNDATLKNNKLDFSEVGFKLATKGPLKLYRNYSSEGYIKSNNISLDYYLSGSDRGQFEEKLITYFFYSSPKIKIFIDDTGVSPIEIDSLLDEGAIDPFSVLLKSMEDVSNEKKCDDIYTIMDGKRRFKAKLTFIGKEYLDAYKQKGFEGDTYHCQISILSNESKATSAIKNLWPFDGNDKVVDIWFSEDLDYLPVKFQFKAPLGKITGKIFLQ